MAHVADWKKKKVAELTTLIASNDVVGLVDISGIPAPLILKMRRGLDCDTTLIVSKKTLIKHALTNAAGKHKGIDKLAEMMDGQVGIITTKKNPFRLYKELESTKKDAPAKGGEKAPNDIMVKKGPTQFKPGPIVGDFQKAGFPAAIESGKVVIKKDKVLVKEGDIIPKNTAQMLTKLEIFPMTVGLNLLGTYEDGTIYTKKILHIDEDEFMGDLRGAITGAFNLAVNAEYHTSFTIKPIVQKAFTEALNLAVFAAIPTAKSIEHLLAKAAGSMLGLASTIKDDDALGEKLKEMLGAAAAAAPAPAETTKDDDDKKDDKEEEPASEEDAAAGLGALFG